MKKIAYFGFTGELICFAHILFNAEDMLNKGYDVKIIIEGSSTKLIPLLGSDKNPFQKIYLSLKEKGVIDAVCQACAHKMGTLEDAKKEGLPIGNDLYGHPSISSYIEKGYEIISV